MDNFFTNPQLFQYLRDELHMGAYGTLRGTFGSKTETCPLDTISSSTPFPYHFLMGSIQRGNVLGALWIDNAPVKLLSTIHTVIGDAATTACDRCLPSDQRCNAPKESVNAVFADPSSDSGTVPEKRVQIFRITIETWVVWIEQTSCVLFTRRTSQLSETGCRSYGLSWIWPWIILFLLFG
jgi:hypothetical protein